MSEKTYVYNDKLQCEWCGIDVIGEKEVAIYLHECDCCDMYGAIEFTKSVMPEVVRIVTYSGEERDTEYRKDHDGNWKALNGSV